VGAVTEDGKRRRREPRQTKEREGALKHREREKGGTEKPGRKKLHGKWMRKPRLWPRPQTPKQHKKNNIPLDTGGRMGKAQKGEAV